MPAYDDRLFSPPAPVARVELRHPDRGTSISDVSVLIDSGADATLLPKSAIAQLGVVGTGKRYRLESFDGTACESDGVQVDLIFLKRRFRGLYLVIEADVGILGRDVLNHIRFLLDGPALHWDEWP